MTIRRLAQTTSNFSLASWSQLEAIQYLETLRWQWSDKTATAVDATVAVMNCINIIVSPLGGGIWRSPYMEWPAIKLNAAVAIVELLNQGANQRDLIDCIPNLIGCTPDDNNFAGLAVLADYILTCDDIRYVTVNVEKLTTWQDRLKAIADCSSPTDEYSIRDQKREPLDRTIRQCLQRGFAVKPEAPCFNS